MAMNQSAVEAQMVGAPDACAEHRRLAIDGEATGADPLLRFAAGRDAHASEDFLQALGFAVRRDGRSRPRARVLPRPAPNASRFFG